MRQRVRTRGPFGVVLALALGCGPRAPVLASLGGPRPSEPDTDVGTRTLVAAWGECVTLGLTDDVGERFFRCVRVFEALAGRRADAVAAIYDEPLARAASCSDALTLVDAAAAALGPLATDDGAIPAWSRLHAIRTGREDEVVSAIDADDLALHGEMLLECSEGPALARLLAVYEADRNASPSPTPPTAAFVEQLVLGSTREAFALVARGHAPPLVVAALRSRPQPAPCPTSAAEVVALLQDPAPERRILGCECVDELPVAARADAAQLRSVLADSDEEQHSVELARGAAEPIAAVDGPAAVPLAVPLMVGGIARMLGPSRRSEQHFPVREACLQAAPPWATAPGSR